MTTFAPEALKPLVNQASSSQLHKMPQFPSCICKTLDNKSRELAAFTNLLIDTSLYGQQSINLGSTNTSQAEEKNFHEGC